MDPRLLTILAEGPATAVSLAQRLETSQPTVSRLIEASRAEVAVLGRRRSTRYGLYRQVRDLPAEVTVHRISRDGESSPIGALIPLRPEHFWFENREDSRRSALFQSLPWFMSDMRPQGYLGRLFPGTFPELQLPDHVGQWNEDHALYALARRGEDAVGNLIVGDESLARWLAQAHRARAIAREGRWRTYLDLAERTLAGEVAGSSAGGEFPKFGAEIAGVDSSQHVLVKFSSSLETRAGQRWSDLLLAEHLASVVLSEHGHAAAVSEFQVERQRAFLEVQRFDRTGTRGRIGLVSLGALDDEFVGQRVGWSESSAVLLRLGRITSDDARELRWLSAFGTLIANADMHLGNASFLHDGRALRLAPAYDMLPTTFAPLRDEVVERQYEIPVPRAGHADQWRAALPVARAYWDRVAADGRVSAEFRKIATGAAMKLQPLSPVR
jgi:hypothetical protein